MSVLVITCLSAGLLDSLNPSAIAQMMIIETMVQKRKNALFFILGIGLANFVLGLGILYGIVNVLASILAHIVERHADTVSTLAFILSLVLFIAGIAMIMRSKTKRSTEGEEEKLDGRAAGASALSPTSVS